MSGAVKTRNIVHKASLLSRFKGAFVGAVVGDCLGAYFEGEWHVKVEGVINFFENLKTWKKEHNQEGTVSTSNILDGLHTKRTYTNSCT